MKYNTVYLYVYILYVIYSIETRLKAAKISPVWTAQSLQERGGAVRADTSIKRIDVGTLSKAQQSWTVKCDKIQDSNMSNHVNRN